MGSDLDPNMAKLISEYNHPSADWMRENKHQHSEKSGLCSSEVECSSPDLEHASGWFGMRHAAIANTKNPYKTLYLMAA